MKKTLLLSVSVCALLFFTSCKSGNYAVGTSVGAGSDQIIGGGGGYAEAVNTIKLKLQKTLERIESGRDVGMLCSNVSVFQKRVFARSALIDNAKTLLENLPKLNVVVANYALSVNGRTVRERVTKEGEKFKAEIEQAAFDRGEGFYLTLHALIHTADEYNDLDFIPGFEGDEHTRQGLDIAGKCGEEFLSYFQYPAEKFYTAPTTVFGTALSPNKSTVIKSLTQSNGKIVVLEDRSWGQGTEASGVWGWNYLCRVYRLNPDGSKDPTFGLNGIYETERMDGNQNGAGNNCYDIALGADDAIYLGGREFVAPGSQQNGSYNLAIVIKLNQDGALVTSFGNANGKLRLSMTGSGNYEGWNFSGSFISSLAVDKMNRIYIGGNYANYSGAYSVAAFARLKSNGIIDGDFYQSGIFNFQRGQMSYVQAVRMGFSDEIFVNLLVQPTHAQHFYYEMIRFNPQGSTVFDNVGPTDAASAVMPYQVDFLRDGTYLISGFDSTRKQLRFHKFLSWGIPDTSFGVAGRISHSFGDMNHDFLKLAFNSEGKIFVGSTVESQDGKQVGFLRMNPDGSLDHTFKNRAGNSGKIVAPLFFGDSILGAVGILRNGAYFALGRDRDALFASVNVFTMFYGDSL